MEITAINEAYLRTGKLTVTTLPRGTAWFDTGTFEAMMSAAQFVHAVEAQQGLKIGCVEEIAWRAGWIGDEELMRLGDGLTKSGYGEYLTALVEEGV